MNALIAGIDPARLGKWVTFAVVLTALVLYMLERVSLELTSLGVICVLLVFFHFNPILGADGGNILDPTRLLAGFPILPC
jgi:di/tricarboxylate transporter